MDNVKVEILKHPTEEDWMLCKKCTLVTIGKDPVVPPTQEWKHKLLASEHSPIRVLHFIVRISNIPYWVAGHLVRHVHSVPFLRSQRNDRQSNYDRNKAPQDEPIDMCWEFNAQELMTIAHKRLCAQASPETRAVVAEICRQVEEVNPEFKGLLVPNCVYRGNLCSEFFPCGKNKNRKQLTLAEDSDNI